jgi:hypothetical protein
VECDWVHLVRLPLTGLLYQPWMIDDECAAVGGMRIGRGNQSTRRKPAPVPLCPPQIPHDLGSNPGRRGGKPATNRLSYGTAYRQCNIKYLHGGPQKATQTCTTYNDSPNILHTDMCSLVCTWWTTDTKGSLQILHIARVTGIAEWKDWRMPRSN